MIGTLAGVEALVPTVGTLGDDSTPTGAQVETWLNEASVLVNGALVGAGYSTVVAGDAAIYPALQAMTQLYAGAYVLRARGLDTLSGGDEAKSEQWMRDFYKRLAWLSSGNLEELGVTVLTTTPRRRRLRTTQIRRIDGYSATYEGSTVAYEHPSE